MTPSPAPACSHVCCARVPSWTARIGPSWRPLPDASWNLYNVLWRAQHAYLTVRESRVRS